MKKVYYTYSFYGKEEYKVERIRELNISSIVTILIKEAAKCDSYSSDVMYDLYSIYAQIELGELKTSDFYFGFRNMGVDHLTFIKNRPFNTYRTIYKLSFVLDENTITATLYQIEKEEELYSMGENHEKINKRRSMEVHASAL